MTDKEYTFKELELMLSKYKEYLERLNLIELSIRHPMQMTEFDTGRKSNVRPNDSMLRTLIKLEEHEQMHTYKKIGIAIENTYAALPEEKQDAMMKFYINRPNGPFRGHAKRTATKLHIDASTLWRWREVIVAQFEIELKRCTALHDIDDKTVVKC
jgi:hypothetical protein